MANIQGMAQIRAYKRSMSQTVKLCNVHCEWGNTHGFQNRKMLFVTKESSIFFQKNFHKISVNNFLWLWVSLVDGLLLKTFVLCTADLYWLIPTICWCCGTAVFLPWELWAYVWLNLWSFVAEWQKFEHIYYI